MAGNNRGMVQSLEQEPLLRQGAKVAQQPSRGNLDWVSFLSPPFMAGMACKIDITGG